MSLRRTVLLIGVLGGGACDPPPPPAGSPSAHCGDPEYAKAHTTLCFGGCKDPDRRKTSQCVPCDAAPDDALCGEACTTDCETTDGSSSSSGTSESTGAEDTDVSSESSSSTAGASTGSTSTGATPICGDELVEGDETCDDGNLEDGDGCSATCTIEGRSIPSDGLDAGVQHSCAWKDGRVRCWGFGGAQLGHSGFLGSIGDDETPSSFPDVEVGGSVLEVVTGSSHSCALMDDGAVRCWGFSTSGQLGYGNTTTIGDDETPASAGDVPLGGTASALSTEDSHTCALMSDGGVRCWGLSTSGSAGYPFSQPVIGDNETPAMMGDVDIGGTAIQVSVAMTHTCVLLDSGAVRCFGDAEWGQLGYGNTDDIGDNEPPYVAGDVSVGGNVVSIEALGFTTCAVLDDATARCWGRGLFGSTAQGNTENIGDNELPSSAPVIDFGDTVERIDGWGNLACARLTSNDIKCWGRGFFGSLGIPGVVGDLGDDETPGSYAAIDIGGRAADVAVGSDFVCAHMMTGGVRCWGSGAGGMLGNLDIEDIGDDEHPSTLGEVSLW